ncbi:MAG TPA: hypothetical protein VJ969_02720 [Desulfopila sp.]|nr:hypothetical protein [Desulfopila sp.]
MAEQNRKRLTWWLWLVTWLALLAGLWDRDFFVVVVIFSACHSLLIMALLRFNLAAFPVQVRIAYFFWVAIGTFVPYMTILMYITIIGLATNLFLSYCPLARMLYLLPWNRQEPFSFDLIRRVMLTPPVPGKFTPR